MTFGSDDNSTDTNKNGAKKIKKTKGRCFVDEKDFLPEKGKHIFLSFSVFVLFVSKIANNSKCHTCFELTFLSRTVFFSFYKILGESSF
jgi:hypothetical protein